MKWDMPTLKDMFMVWGITFHFEFQACINLHFLCSAGKMETWKKNPKPFAYYAQQTTFYEVIHTVQRLRASDGNALQMSSPAKYHLVWGLPPNTSPWLEGKQTPSKNDNLLKGSRTYRNLRLIPSHCRRCTDWMHLDSRLLFPSANRSANSECSEWASTASTAPAQRPPHLSRALALCVLQRHLADVSQTWCITAVKIWGNYQLETQNRSDW